jgi:hypothetical protein
MVVTHGELLTAIIGEERSQTGRVQDFHGDIQQGLDNFCGIGFGRMPDTLIRQLSVGTTDKIERTCAENSALAFFPLMPSAIMLCILWH